MKYILRAYIDSETGVSEMNNTMSTLVDHSD